MRITKLEQLTVGLVVYKAYAFERNGFVDFPMQVAGEPYTTKDCNIICIPCFRESEIESFFCPADANIGGSHNKHRLYTTKAEAEGYVNYVRRIKK